MGTTVTEIMELADMHAYAQIADGTPARMLPRNLLQSKVEALIDLHTENEQLRAGYDAARLEIASLRERVQQLGQLARDVNSRRVTELEAQLEAIGAGGVEPLRKRECLHKISEPARCWCHACRPITVADCRMVLCPYCGNKRCPKANDHRHDCTGSNEPGQQGSAYPSQGITAAKKGGQHGAE